MSNWKYNIDKEGVELRNLLNNAETLENIADLYTHIIECLNTIRKMLTRKDSEKWGNEIDNMIEDLEMAQPDLSDDLNYKEEEDNLNYYLDEFYNLCDNIGVWIGI